MDIKKFIAGGKPQRQRQRDTKKSDNEKFADVSWLMPSMDVKLVLDRLNVEIDKQIGDEIWGWCPDHKLFVGKDASHPKWSVNIKNGKTKCMTEDRGSNIVYIVSRLLDKSPKEAVEWMIGGGKFTEAIIDGMQREFGAMVASREAKPKKTVKGLHSMSQMIDTGSMNDAGYKWFMYPPDKLPTLIEKDTVDHFGCVMAQGGRYANRVIIPVKMRGEIVGWNAVDTIGAKEWLRRHPTIAEKEYRKVMYPSGFSAKTCLFGFDECTKDESVVAIVEGAREVMKMWQLGYKALAVMGSGMSDDQIELLAEISPRSIVIAMDGDDAGYRAQKKIRKKLTEFFSRLYDGNLPEGHDPKSLDPKDVEKFMNLSNTSGLHGV